MSFLSVQGETPRHTSSATPSLHSNRTSIPSLRSNRSNPQKKQQHANGSTAHEQLFAVLRRLCTSCMITALDFVERHNPSLNDPNMFNINSAILESDPLNPPTLTSTEFWALVKERSGIDPPDWQKKKCFHKLDIRRTGTISYARLKAGATLFDPDLTMDKSVQRRSSNVAMQKWIDVSASDCMNTLSRKLRRKHNTDLGHELYAHFVRACVPASVSAKMNDKHQKINFAHFVRGLKAYNVLDFSKTSSHQTMKKLFSSLDHENKGHISSKEFVQQGLEDGAQGSGNQAGQYTDKSRKLNEEQSRHKKQIRQQLRQKLQSKDFKHVTASEVLEILREKIKSKMLTSNSELNAHRIFAHAAGLDGGSTQTNFNFQTFQQGFRKLGLSDIPNDTLKLVFQALDINNDGDIEYNEFVHILTLDQIDENSLESFRSLSSSQASSSRTSSVGSLPQLSTRSTGSTKSIRSTKSMQKLERKSNNNNNNNNKSMNDTKEDVVDIASTVFQRWKQMLKLFVAVDKNSKGALYKHEFGDVLSRFGVHAKGKEFDQLFAKYDTDGNGSIDYREFLGHFMGNNNDVLASAFASISNLEQGVDMRNQKERDIDLSINTLHKDDDINALLQSSNVFEKHEPGYYDNGGSYDVRLLKPLTTALRANEIASGVVPIHMMFKIFKWHGIDMTTLNISENATVEIRPTTEGGRIRRKKTSPSWKRVRGKGGGGGTIMRSSPRIVSARSERSETSTMVGIKYLIVLRDLFQRKE